MNNVQTLSDLQAVEVNNLLNAIAYKRKHWFKNLSQEDIVSELWIHVLEAIDKYGLENINNLQSFVSNLCKFRLVDMVRQNVKHDDIPVNPSMYDRCVDVDDNSENSNSTMNQFNHSIDTCQEIEDIEDMLSIRSLFPEGSKEREFIEIWIKYSGAEPDEVIPESALNYYAAEKLGYANASSSGYKRLRGKVRAVLEEYIHC